MPKDRNIRQGRQIKLRDSTMSNSLQIKFSFEVTLVRQQGHLKCLQCLDGNWIHVVFGGSRQEFHRHESALAGQLNPVRSRPELESGVFHVLPVRAVRQKTSMLFSAQCSNT